MQPQRGAPPLLTTVTPAPRPRSRLPFSINLEHIRTRRRSGGHCRQSRTAERAAPRGFCRRWCLADVGDSPAELQLQLAIVRDALQRERARGERLARVLQRRGHA